MLFLFCWRNIHQHHDGILAAIIESWVRNRFPALPVTNAAETCSALRSKVGILCLKNTFFVFFSSFTGLFLPRLGPFAVWMCGTAEHFPWPGEHFSSQTGFREGISLLMGSLSPNWAGDCFPALHKSLFYTGAGSKLLDPTGQSLHPQGWEHCCGQWESPGLVFLELLTPQLSCPLSRADPNLRNLSHQKVNEDWCFPVNPSVCSLGALRTMPRGSTNACQAGFPSLFHVPTRSLPPSPPQNAPCPALTQDSTVTAALTKPRQEMGWFLLPLMIGVDKSNYFWWVGVRGSSVNRGMGYPHPISSLESRENSKALFLSMGFLK